MQVNNKTMYHIHRENEHDELWKIGNEFIVDDNFYSNSGLSIPSFNTNVRCSDGSYASLETYLKKYLQEDSENIETTKTLLKDAYRIICNANKTKCETALEICRRNKFQLYPSRMHSIWVTDKDNLDYWQNILKGEHIFELRLTGTLFKSSDIYIPNNNLSLIQAIEASESYWNPVFTKEAEAKKEYLFQGKVFIKRKIN